MLNTNDCLVIPCGLTIDFVAKWGNYEEMISRCKENFELVLKWQESFNSFKGLKAESNNAINPIYNAVATLQKIAKKRELTGWEEEALEQAKRDEYEANRHEINAGIMY